MDVEIEGVLWENSGEEIAFQDIRSRGEERKMVDIFRKGVSILDVYTGKADDKETER